MSGSLFAGSDKTKLAPAPSESKSLHLPPISTVSEFNAKKSISDLVYAGAIVDKTSTKTEAAAERVSALAPGEVPQVKVNLQSPNEKSRPDFLIKTDGTVEMLNNPLKSGQKQIVVEFERNGDKIDLTDAQKQAGGSFYQYLESQLKHNYPQAAADSFKTDDSQGLLRDSKLPPEVKKNLEQQQQKSELPPSSGLPERSTPTMQDTRRITDGGRSSSVPRSDVNDMTPPAQRIPHEADRVQAMKDTIASYVTRGDQHPYDYVGQRGDRGWAVGRYGMTYNQVSNWLSGLTEQEIQELVAEGKLSAQQAAGLEKLRASIEKAQQSGNDNDLDPFLKSLKSGQGNADDIRKGVQQYLPDKVQELAASDQIAKISGSLAREAILKGEDPTVNPGQVALSFVLGRNVSKAEFSSNNEYKNFVDSANQAYRLQEQAIMQGGDMIHVENMSQVSQALNQMVGQQFWREAASATEYGNKGCAIAVTRMLQHMGVQIGAHLDVTGTAEDMIHRGWKMVSLDQAIHSGQLYVAVNKETGSHVGLGIGDQVWENSSARRQVVTHDIHQSTLRHSGRAFIVPIQASGQAA